MNSERVSERAIWFWQQKAYYDCGFNILSAAKYPLGFYSIASRDAFIVLIVGCVFAFACYFTGLIAFKRGWVKAMTEVSNRQNKFVLEMRKKLKIRKA